MSVFTVGGRELYIYMQRKVWAYMLVLAKNHVKKKVQHVFFLLPSVRPGICCFVLLIVSLIFRPIITCVYLQVPDLATSLSHTLQLLTWQQDMQLTLHLPFSHFTL